MKNLSWIGVGLLFGALATWLVRSEPRLVHAGNDRHEDYIMCTGQIQLAPNMYADTVWLLDYRAGKLLGTIVDRNVGKVAPWKEVDLVQEFKLAPKQNVHFMMTTGQPGNGAVGFPGQFGYLHKPPANPTTPSTTPPPPPTTPPGTPPPPPNAPPPPPPTTPPGVVPLPQEPPRFLHQQPMNTPGTLYVAETQTGRFAVYTIALHPDPRVGLVILRHDATRFRAE